MPYFWKDTGFGKFLPTGEGLFSFNSIEEVVTALATINHDYEKHSRAARAIAEEFFGAERVLKKWSMTSVYETG